MFDTMLVPLCPNTSCSRLESFLLSRGWLWSKDSLNATLHWLELEGIACERDFVGLGDIECIDGSNIIESEIKTFLQQLVKVCTCMWHLPCVYLVLTC